MKTPQGQCSHVTGPILKTDRLDLRWMTLDDAPQLQRICQSREVAAMSGLIPHPYPEGEAERFIRRTAVTIVSGEEYAFGIVERSTGTLIGDLVLQIDQKNRSAEIGYILAEDAWGNGYATEAASVIPAYTFETLGLRRLWGRCSTANQASARVMEKIGLEREGCLRDAYLKWGVFEDEYYYGLTRPVYEQRQREQANR